MNQQLATKAFQIILAKFEVSYLGMSCESLNSVTNTEIEQLVEDRAEATAWMKELENIPAKLKETYNQYLKEMIDLNTGKSFYAKMLAIKKTVHYRNYWNNTVKYSRRRMNNRWYIQKSQNPFKHAKFKNMVV